uniref:60S ribosomal protein L13 n=2 Tax=Ostreococcus mediterraneus TaxID=1486918 RepID=A0A7S0PKJ3_9CHLO|mmetsp:Transcript_1316/g.4779  ORF Transcript_1316/g.4779 Transcript_1316/m.4779 type:complete len:220 (+) Transcript_1316:59-718(+)
MKGNNQLPNAHFKKDWQGNAGPCRVRTWLNQAGRKKSRRNARATKAAKTFPRPVAGALRPVVQSQTQRYNFKKRLGRGFTLDELKAAGVSKKMAPTIGICVDHRRRNRCEESLALNSQRLKDYMAKLVLFPRKNSKPKHGDSPAADLAAATQHKGAAVMPIEKVAKTVEMVAVTEEMKAFGAYGKLRTERMNVRQVGPRIKKAIQAEKDAEEKAKLDKL